MKRILKLNEYSHILNEDCVKIMLYDQWPKSVQELSKILDIPQATCYKKVAILSDLFLLDVKGKTRFQSYNSKPRVLYSSLISKIEITKEDIIITYW